MTTSRHSQTQGVQTPYSRQYSKYQSADTSNVDTKVTQLSSKRSRGMVLSVVGFKRLQAAIEAAEIQENDGNRFTQEELSDRMKISPRTVSRLWSLTAGLDQRTLKRCFSAFNLELTAKDYTNLRSCSDHDKLDVMRQLPKNPKLVDISEFYKYPSGPEPLNSIFYISRPPIEELAYQEITQSGCFIRIKAPKQMGKSSLTYRILAHGESLGYHTVKLDLNQVDASIMSDVNKFLRWFCKSISGQLKLESKIDDYWDEEIGTKLSTSIYVSSYLLECLDSPLVLALNEINRLFEYPELAQELLSLLRSWHESAQQEAAWQKLRIVVVYSTEIYIPLDINQSPCNVGLPLQLPEFTHSQVQDLALRHGINLQQGNQTEELMAMVGGHPGLVRIALYYLYSKQVTLSQLLQDASTDTGIYITHLRQQLSILQKSTELKHAFEAVISAQRSISLEPALAYKLESMGLVKFNQDGVTISRELYRRYFQVHLFQNETTHV